MKTLKGLSCGILESKDIGNCSAGGLSSKCKSVTLLGIYRLNGKFETDCEVFEPSDNSPPVVVIERDCRNKSGKPYLTAYPANPDGTLIEKPLVGPMFGGCYIATSDGRFPAAYPIPLHDRWV